MDLKKNHESHNNLPSYSESVSPTLYHKYSPPPYEQYLKEQLDEPLDVAESNLSEPQHTCINEYNTEPPPSYCIQQPPRPTIVVPRNEQVTTSVTIISSQPLSRSSGTRTPYYGVNSDYYMTVSVILTMLCLFSCSYLWLLCTIPAFILSSKAVKASSVGNGIKAQKYGRLSLVLNVAAVITWIIFWAAIVVLVSSKQSSTRNHNAYYHYYYYK